MTVAPELAERLAKLLRLACSTGPDGEKLAAIGRLSAIAEAHDICWDRALANGDGRGLDEEAATRIYWEGHARGCEETEQRLKPQPDWTPAASSSAPVGSDAERIADILKTAAEYKGLLTDWENQFADDMRDRFERYRARMRISEKQWKILDRIASKLSRACDV